jgi:hypothetical protein
MSKHRISTRSSRLARALSAAAAIGSTALVVAPDASAASPAIIFIDGTKPIIPGSTDHSASGVGGGVFENLPGFTKTTVIYPRSFGVLTGLSDPGYDDSVTIAQQGVVEDIKAAQNGDPTVPVIVVGYSQGADAASRANDELQKAGYSQSNVTYLLVGSPDNADGGILTRIPNFGSGVTVPLLGITLGNSTATSSHEAHIVQLTREYDGVGDAPVYVLNVLADANAVAGFVVLHGTYDTADPYSTTNIVTTTPDGKITNIEIPTSEVPLLTLAVEAGLPQPVADVLNPTLKAVIDTGYNRPAAGVGTYPTTTQSFQLLPDPSKWAGDAQSIQAGVTESTDVLSNDLRSSTSGSQGPTGSPNVIRQNVVQGRSQVQQIPPVQNKPKPSIFTRGNLFQPSTLAGGSNSNANSASGSGLAAQSVNAAVSGALHNAIKNVAKSLSGSKSGSSSSSGASGSGS